MWKISCINPNPRSLSVNYVDPGRLEVKLLLDCPATRVHSAHGQSQQDARHAHHDQQGQGGQHGQHGHGNQKGHW